MDNSKEFVKKAPPVHCFKCGRQNLVDGETDSLQDALSKGWIEKDGKCVCKWCQFPKHILNRPYHENGICYLDIKNDQGDINVWGLKFEENIPKWDFIKCKTLF